MEIRERNGFVARKDNRGRNLRTGESQRKDGLYMYRYKDERTGRRLAVYSPDLAELRKKEKEIEKDQSEGILTDTQCKNMTLNDLFEIHMDTRKLAESTQGFSLIVLTLSVFFSITVNSSASNICFHLRDRISDILNPVKHPKAIRSEIL